MSHKRSKSNQFLPSLGSLPSLSLEIDKGISNLNKDTDTRSPKTPTYQGDDPDSQPYDPCTMFSFPSLKIGFYEIVSPSSCTTSETEGSLSSIDLPIDLPIVPPPPRPLSWIWICHLCHSRYPLGATRRCLVDGHFYCSGEAAATQRNVKRKKRGMSCSSEFDYQGWKEWGLWRRKMLSAHTSIDRNLVRQSYTLEGCQKCDYPSQCRQRTADSLVNTVSTGSNTNAKINADTKLKSNEHNTTPTGISNDSVNSHDHHTPQTEETKHDPTASSKANHANDSMLLPTSAQVDTNLTSLSQVQPVDSTSIPKTQRNHNTGIDNLSKWSSRYRERKEEKQNVKPSKNVSGTPIPPGPTKSHKNSNKEYTVRHEHVNNLSGIKGRFYSSHRLAP